MDIAALIFSVIAITVIAYDFRARTKIMDELLKTTAELESSSRVLGETHNAFVKVQQTQAERLELLELKLSGLVAANTSNRRI